MFKAFQVLPPFVICIHVLILNLALDVIQSCLVLEESLLCFLAQLLNFSVMSQYVVNVNLSMEFSKPLQAVQRDPLAFAAVFNELSDLGVTNAVDERVLKDFEVAFASSVVLEFLVVTEWSSVVDGEVYPVAVWYPAAPLLRHIHRETVRSLASDASNKRLPNIRQLLEQASLDLNWTLNQIIIVGLRQGVLSCLQRQAVLSSTRGLRHLSVSPLPHFNTSISA